MNMNQVKATLTSFKDVQDMVAGRELPIGGYNEDGEFVMVIQGRREEDLGRSYQIETLQSNGWSRINTYWEDGTKEETYKRSSEETMSASKKGLEDALNEWVGKVMRTYTEKLRKGGGVNTLGMIKDVDKIIADAFGHDTVL